MGFWDIAADVESSEGPLRHLRGHARIEGASLLFEADAIDYNEETKELEARGNVHYKSYERNEEMFCERLEYNTETERGRFYEGVKGSGNPRIDARPGILTSTSPFHFEGEWAERIGERYILHNGFVTNCKMPRPWWTLRGPTFDIVPGERAIAYRTIFRVKSVPIFYAPYFRKSLEKAPRRSGFLVPNLGNSSRRGKMFGVGYYWAINRSYDATYRFQDFTDRGYAHNIDVRGKPRAGSDFDFILYGVQDRGRKQDDGSVIKEGGFNMYLGGKSDLGHGFLARGELNYLSSLTFRQAFTDSFNESISSESHSTGYLMKQWSAYTFDVVVARLENFQSTQPGDSIVIRRLPELRFQSRDQQPVKDLPFWVSLESSVGMLRRTQPLFQTRQFTERADFAPRVMTALRWKDFHILPSFGIRETHYGESQQDQHIAGHNLNRDAREAGVDVVLPSLARVYKKKYKHVIESRASYSYRTGISDFDQVIRFDETDVLSNTNELEVAVINRLYAKRGNQVTELFSWELWQKRYFDPTFGGAVVAGQRNVVASAIDLTPNAFLSGPRPASPVVSVFRASPRSGVGIEWRADYDRPRGGIVNSTLSADVRFSRYFVSVGHSQVRCVPLAPGADCHDSATQPLVPPANQFRGAIVAGNDNRRGWNAAFNMVYDYRVGALQYATTQVTYNTDCCGLSVQFRRFSFGTLNDNQFRVAFAVANIGTFGTLKKQERLF